MSETNKITVKFNPVTNEMEITGASEGAKITTEKDGSKVKINIQQNTENDYVDAKFDDEPSKRASGAKNTETSQSKSKDKKSADNIDLETFKSEIREEAGIVKRLVKRFGYKKMFKLLDKNGDNVLSKSELNKLSKGAESLSDIKEEDVREFAKEYREKKKQERKANKLFAKSVDLLKQFMNNSAFQDNTGNLNAANYTGDAASLASASAGAVSRKGNFTFNFSENLSSVQQSALSQFKSHWQQNKGRYQALENRTGIPAELIAALHWRESGGDFSRNLQEGGSLAKYGTFENSAIQALSGRSVDKNNINTWYEMAERYNGLGYRNKGVVSPYVWAGTTKYSCGKYVRDGVYDPNHKDQQLGVAVMLKAIMV